MNAEFDWNRKFGTNREFFPSLFYNNNNIKYPGACMLGSTSMF
jgi:hypothetical protein